MNNVTLIGRLTKDITIQYTDGKEPKAYCRFNIAIDKGKDRQGQDMGADYPSIIVWGKQAESCDKYLKKGSQVGIIGSIRTGRYEDKDGKTVYTTDVQATRVEFLEWDKPAEKQETLSGFSQIDSEDIPF